MSDEVDEDPTGVKALWDRGLLNGASQKADIIANFYVGETVLSLQKATLIPGGSEPLVYTTLSGTIGVVVPFTSHEVCDLFSTVTSCLWTFLNFVVLLVFFAGSRFLPASGDAYAIRKFATMWTRSFVL